jgi:hypothetical protein
MTNLPLWLGLGCGGLFFLAFLVVGILLVAGNVRARKRADASQTWPSTTGRILLSEIRISQTRDDDGNLQAPSFYPYVEYDYILNGQVYKSHKLGFGGHEMFTTHELAAAKLAPYPVGANVQLFFNPQKPDDSVLERVAPKSKAGLVVGIIMLALGACGGLGILVSLIMNLLRIN